jgi:hypothetical protein
MCFSARVRQALRELARRHGAEIAWEMFADLSNVDWKPAFKATRALEQNFDDPGSGIEQLPRNSVTPSA